MLQITLKQLKENLKKSWTESDLARRDRLLVHYEEVHRNYKKFFLTYNYNWNDLNFMHQSPNQIRTKVEKDVNVLVKRFETRAEKIIGTAINCAEVRLTLDGMGLEGFIYGEKGNAKITSIGAGGYNIQRFHIRILIKAI